MGKKLQGRVALVTGGARGIGAASAAALAAEGAAVLITDVLDEDGERTAAEISSKGGRIGYRHHDVRDEAAWLAAVGEAEKRFGGLDILLNNAGIFALKPMSETTIEEFRHMQAINVEGVFLGMKCAIPAIGKRAQQWPGGGSIINLSSVAGLTGASFAVPYNASKGAVRLMTKGAALECAQLGYKIRVNSIHPGIIDTMMGQKVMDDLASTGAAGANEVRANMIALHPLGRLGVAGDIANAVVFLASDDAAFMTGSEVVVDGGMTAR
ncbi:MAG: glucose 1-dehydrogenase [Alphaproteobacteria bacterium]|nr:glucose 1-dehydrogenase [Alphaproteobacteria bacterium]